MTMPPFSSNQAMSSLHPTPCPVTSTLQPTPSPPPRRRSVGRGGNLQKAYCKTTADRQQFARTASSHLSANESARSFPHSRDGENSFNRRNLPSAFNLDTPRIVLAGRARRLSVRPRCPCLPKSILNPFHPVLGACKLHRRQRRPRSCDFLAVDLADVPRGRRRPLGFYPPLSHAGKPWIDGVRISLRWNRPQTASESAHEISSNRADVCGRSRRARR